MDTERKSDQGPTLVEQSEDAALPDGRWIPVSERLPDSVDEQVLIYSENKYGVRQGYYSVGAQRWYDCFDNSAGNVTHWMPLPSPPTDKQP